MKTRPVSRRDVYYKEVWLSPGWRCCGCLSWPKLSIQPGEDVLPWLDQPAPNPVPGVPGNQPQWEALDSWITPNDQFFTMAHYDKPVLDGATWRLQIVTLRPACGSSGMTLMTRREVPDDKGCGRDHAVGSAWVGINLGGTHVRSKPGSYGRRAGVQGRPVGDCRDRQSSW